MIRARSNPIVSAVLAQKFCGFSRVVPQPGVGRAVSRFVHRLAWLVVVAGCAGPAASTTPPTPTSRAEPAPPTEPAAEPTKPAIEIKRGTAITVDGRATTGEWADAGSLAIETAPGWHVEVRFKHDGTALVFAFANLASAKRDAFRYPEIVLDIKNDGGPMMGTDDHWFHASFQDCAGSAGVNDYKSCVPEGAGWSANNYVSQDAAPELIEISIPFAKLGLTAGQREIGIAFDVTDTMETWSFWPTRAQLAIPATWGHATIVP
jgi:hypothetical protein